MVSPQQSEDLLKRRRKLDRNRLCHMGAADHDRAVWEGTSDDCTCRLEYESMTPPSS